MKHETFYAIEPVDENEDSFLCENCGLIASVEECPRCMAILPKIEIRRSKK